MREREREVQKSGWLRSGYRLIFIGIVVVLMAATVYVVGTGWVAGQADAEIESLPQPQQVSVPAEPLHLDAGSLSYLEQMRQYTAALPAEDAKRTLDVYYARRAYDGAPPWIPHPVDDAMSIGAKSCLQCHGAGGYAPAMEAYAPVVPHPELASCTQCHVPVAEEELFRESAYEPAAPPQLTGGAYEGAPPPMPHELQMRENCAACHAGPAAPPEIATDHIDRDNCQQCHVPGQSDDTWDRTQSAWNRDRQLVVEEEGQ